MNKSPMIAMKLTEPGSVFENRLAAELVAGKFTDGDKIRVDAVNHTFTFEKI